MSGIMEKGKGGEGGGGGTKDWGAVEGDIVEVLFGEEWRRAHLVMLDIGTGKWRAALEAPVEGMSETDVRIPDPAVRLVTAKAIMVAPAAIDHAVPIEAHHMPVARPVEMPLPIAPSAPSVPIVAAVAAEAMEEDLGMEGGIKGGTLQIGDFVEVKQDDGKFAKGEVKSKRKDGIWRVICDDGVELQVKYPDEEREVRRLPRKARPYDCSNCGKAFLRASHLSTHMRTHSGEKPHKCNQCTKSFAQSSNLRTHMRTHTGEKPYTCGNCSKSFADPSALSAHKRIHTGERMHKCIECQKTFLRATHLTTHTRTHSGEKPHKCTICTKAFAQSSNLSTHMRTHAAPGSDGNKNPGLKRKRGKGEGEDDKENMDGHMGVGGMDQVSALPHEMQQHPLAAAVLAHAHAHGLSAPPIHNPAAVALAALGHMAPMAPVGEGGNGGAEAPPPPPVEDGVTVTVAAPV